MTLRPQSLFLAIALAVAGCSSDTTAGGRDSLADEASGAGPREVEVELSEFAFQPETVRVEPGETVRFLVTNEGALGHELRLTNDLAITEHLDIGHEVEHADDSDPAGADLAVFVAPGQTAELEVAFPEDSAVYTTLACLLPGHYESGMRGKITYSG